MAKIGGIGVHSPGVGVGGTPPDAPVITEAVDGGDGSSIIVSIIGTDTIRLYYRIQYSSSSWSTGLTRSGSGDITQIGLSSGTWYEFYCVADDSSLVSAPSNIKVQRVSGIASVSLALGMSPAFILYKLITKSMASMTNPLDNASWPLYVSYMPDGKNIKVDCGTVYDTVGTNDGRTMENGEVVVHPGIQLRIRAKAYTTGFSKIEAVALSLDDITRELVVVNGTTFQIHAIHTITPIIPLGLERGKKRRFLFTANFLMTIKKVAA